MGLFDLKGAWLKKKLKQINGIIYNQLNIVDDNIDDIIINDIFAGEGYDPHDECFDE